MVMTGSGKVAAVADFGPGLAESIMLTSITSEKHTVVRQRCSGATSIQATWRRKSVRR